MKALLLSKYRHLEIADLPSPVPAPDEVLIGVSACGICGSDVHGYDGSSGRRIPPIVMGHEAAGIVASAGADVRKVSQGDRVTFDSTVFCGVCPFCLRGEINLCDNRKVLGVSCGDYRRAGAFAEFVAVPERIVHRLPESLAFPHAAMLEAVSVALHAVSLSQVKIGQSRVSPWRRNDRLVDHAGASRCRMRETFMSLTWMPLGSNSPASSEPRELYSPLARLVFADFRFDKRSWRGLSVGSSRNQRYCQCRRKLRSKGGTVTLVGNISAEVTLPLQKVVTRQIRMQGSCASAGEYPQAIELISSGKIQVATAHHCYRSSRRWAALVRAALLSRTKFDEGSSHSQREANSHHDQRTFRPQRTSCNRYRDQPRPGRNTWPAPWQKPALIWLSPAATRKLWSAFEDEIKKTGRRVLSLELDVRNQLSIQNMAAAAEKFYGRLDILVNNAGCNVRKPALDVTWDDWNLILDTNLRGSFFVAQEVRTPHGFA